MSFVDTLHGFGLTPDYFLHFAFLNETGSITYLLIFSILFVFTGGLFAWAIAFAIALVLSIILSRFIINRRATPIDNAAIIITGCSTGIGYEMALNFAVERGFTVFSTVRKQSDADALLSAFKNTPTPVPEPGQTPFKRGDIVPVIMDVTDGASIDAAHVHIESVLQQRKLILISLINNAGYGQPTQLELIDEKRAFDQFNANVYGLINVTNHFIPLLRYAVIQLKEINSNIVPSILNVGSIASFTSLSPLGMYSSTKWAVRAISETYRHELSRCGISVTTICPGAVKTNFYRTSTAHLQLSPKTITTTQSTTAEGSKRESTIEKLVDLTVPIEPYVQEYYHAWGNSSNENLPSAEKIAYSPLTVVRACYDVVLSPRPNSFYPTGLDSILMVPILRWCTSTGVFDWPAIKTGPSIQIEKATKND